MNTRTGEIRQFKPSDLLPAGYVELGNLPDPKCRICKGKGHAGQMIVGRKHRRRVVYRPCDCTQPLNRKGIAAI